MKLNPPRFVAIALLLLHFCRVSAYGAAFSDDAERPPLGDHRAWGNITYFSVVGPQLAMWVSLRNDGRVRCQMSGEVVARWNTDKKRRLSASASDGSFLESWSAVPVFYDRQKSLSITAQMETRSTGGKRGARSVPFGTQYVGRPLFVMNYDGVAATPDARILQRYLFQFCRPSWFDEVAWMKLAAEPQELREAWVAVMLEWLAWGSPRRSSLSAHLWMLPERDAGKRCIETGDACIELIRMLRERVVLPLDEDVGDSLRFGLDEEASSVGGGSK